MKPKNPEGRNARRFLFTATKLKSFPRPETGKIRCFDLAVAGHCARITANGVITLGLYRWFPNTAKPVDVTFGRFPELPIAESRKLAIERIAEITKGINPNQVKLRAKGELTLGELYASVRQHEYSQIKTPAKYDSMFRCHLSRWTNKKLSEITRPMIQALHAKIGNETGKYAANRVLELISGLFNKARDRGFDKPNPAQGIRAFKEKSRDRFVQPDEAKALFDAIFAEENTTLRDFLLMAILTGARRSNVLSMRWEDLNLTRSVWRLRETKNGEPQLIPLVPMAVRILRDRNGNDSPWVFDNPLSKSGHVEDPKSAWARVLKRAKIEDLRIHDLRRTFGSWQAIGGTSLHIIGKSLNHRSYEATQVYARLHLDPIRESVERATDSLLKAGGITLEPEEPATEETNEEKKIAS